MTAKRGGWSGLGDDPTQHDGPWTPGCVDCGITEPMAFGGPHDERCFDCQEESDAQLARIEGSIYALDR